MNAQFLNRYAAHHHLTPEAAEATILATLEEIARIISSKISFGPYQKNDIYQEVCLAGLLLMEKDAGTYDPRRPIGNYFMVSLRNRMLNLKRDKYFRSAPCCTCCDRFNPPDNPCPRLKRWLTNNARKRQLSESNPAPDANPSDAASDEAAIDRELVKEIDDFVDWSFLPTMRNDYLRLKAGATIPPARKNAVSNAILAKFGPLYDEGASLAS